MQDHAIPPAYDAFPGHDPAYRQRGQMLYGVHEMSRLISVTYDRLMAKHGLTYAQWWTLMHVGNNQGASQSEIARLLGMGRAAAGQQIKRIEDMGFLIRRPDANDKRAMRLFLTAAGAEIMRPMGVEGGPYLARIMAGISREEESVMADLVVRILANLHAELER